MVLITVLPVIKLNQMTIFGFKLRTWASWSAIVTSFSKALAYHRTGAEIDY